MSSLVATGSSELAAAFRSFLLSGVRAAAAAFRSFLRSGVRAAVVRPPLSLPFFVLVPAAVKG